MLNRLCLEDEIEENAGVLLLALKDGLSSADRSQ